MHVATQYQLRDLTFRTERTPALKQTSGLMLATAKRHQSTPLGDGPWACCKCLCRAPSSQMRSRDALAFRCNLQPRRLDWRIGPTCFLQCCQRLGGSKPTRRMCGRPSISSAFAIGVAAWATKRSGISQECASQSREASRRPMKPEIS